MAETKFTPGPWIAGHLGSDRKCQCSSILAEGYMGCIATVEVDNGRAVSDGGNDAPPLEEAVANMHLIAAAPDLYEAGEPFEFALRHGNLERDDINDSDLVDIIISVGNLRALKAARAKARGEAI